MNALDLAYGLGAAVLAPMWARKSRGGWDERMARIEPLPEPRKPRIVIHGVSVGEIAALGQLIPMLTGRAEVIVTASTDTGISRARSIYETDGSPVRVLRYPLDFSASVKRFLDAVQPDAVVLCELEVWPNFLAACSRRGIATCVINGRLSEKSFKGYKRVRPLLRKSFASLAFAAVQDADYAQRFTAMGTPAERTHITGTMKWDTAVIVDEVAGADELAQQMGIDRSKPLIVAGSTAEGEEALLHAACPPGAQLLCAPRKPERFDAAAADMMGCIRRSWTKPDSPTRRPTMTLGTSRARFLLDTLGELRKAYALADLVVVGRSFGTGQGGGSDPIEPIGLGKPTMIGPDYTNFQSVVTTLRKAGGLSVVTPGELRVALMALMNDQQRRSDLVRKGRACIREHQGATRVHADMILNLVKDVHRSGAGNVPQPV